MDLGLSPGKQGKTFPSIAQEKKLKTVPEPAQAPFSYTAAPRIGSHSPVLGRIRPYSARPLNTSHSWGVLQQPVAT